jgi:transposase
VTHGAVWLKGQREGGTLATKKPPSLGLIERGGGILIRLVENVQRTTTKPSIEAAIAPGTCIYTDEDAIYGRMEQ